MLAMIFLCLAVILVGAVASPKPVGWIVLGFAVLALVMTIMGWPVITFGGHH